MRFVSMLSSQAARVRSVAIAPGTIVPALLNATSRPPNRDSARSTSPCANPVSRTSPARHAACPPACWISVTAWSSSAWRRAPSTTWAPWRAKRIAAARPIPELAPVRRAVLPVRSWVTGMVLSWGSGIPGVARPGRALTVPRVAPVGFRVSGDLIRGPFARLRERRQGWSRKDVDVVQEATRGALGSN